MKHRILLIAGTAIIVTVLAVYFLLELANDRRINAIEEHLDTVSAALVEQGISQADIQRVNSCEQTQEKYGEGARYCGRDIVTNLENVSLEQARGIYQNLNSSIKELSNVTLSHENSLDFEPTSANATGVRASAQYVLEDLTTCIVRAHFSKNDADRSIGISNLEVGSLNIFVGCQDNSWWSRTF